MIPEALIRETARQILAGREFAARSGQGWWQHLMAWLKEFFLRLFPQGPAGEGSGVGKFLLRLIDFLSRPEVVFGLKCLVGIGVGLLLWLVYRAIRQSVVVHLESPPLRRDPKRLETQADWEAEAERLRQEGRYIEAINALFHGLLRGLAERGIVSAPPGTTNREYVRIVEGKTSREFVDLLGELVRLHEEKSYALRRCGPEDYDRCLGLYRQCMEWAR